MLSSIPFDLILLISVGGDFDAMTGSGNSAQATKAAKATKAMKISRVLKLAKFARILRLGRIAENLEDFLYLHRNSMSMLKIFIITFCVAHIMSCGWGVVARLDDGLHHNSWASDYRLDDAPLWDQYLAALYWALSTMTTVGYGDVVPITNAERFYALFGMVLGSGYYGYIIASMASLVASMDTNNRVFNERMDAVLSYMRMRKFSPDMFTRVRRYEATAHSTPPHDGLLFLLGVEKHINTLHLSTDATSGGSPPSHLPIFPSFHLPTLSMSVFIDISSTTTTWCRR